MGEGSCRNTWSFSVVSSKAYFLFVYFVAVEICLVFVMFFKIEEMISMVGMYY